MIEMKQLNQEHKAVSFGNSKIIFLFNNDQPHQNTSAIQKGKLKEKVKSNIHNSMRSNLTQRKNKENSKCCLQIPKEIQKPLTSQFNRKKYNSKPNTSNSSRISPLKTAFVQKQKLNIRQNISELKVKDLTTRSKVQEVDLSKNNNQITTSVFHQGIRQLFGNHHNFYIPNIDYLIQFQNNSTIRKSLSQSQNYEKLKLKAETKIGKKIITKFLIPSHTSEVSKIRASYNFQNERAPIIDYITDNALPLIYDKITKQNLKTRKYVDQQFCHEDIKYIDEKKAKWTYISPHPQLSLFSTNSHQTISLTNTQLQIPFIKFMVFLYAIDPKIFMRLIEPPINNVYSVWFFIEGTFQPIIIDGYFPLDCSLGNYQNNLWMAVFSKCICKIFGTYQSQTLKKISHSQIYLLLYGQNLYIVLARAFSSSDTLFNLLKKQKKKNKVIVYENNNNIQVIHSNFNIDSSKLFKKRFEQQQEGKGNFYIIEPVHNFFIYPIKIFESNLTKFQVIIEKACQLKFCFQNSSLNEKECICIYESISYFGQKQKSQLKLQYQINCQDIKPIKLKAGQYKMFYSHGQKKIRQAFQSNTNQNQQNICLKKPTIKVSLLSSIRIQMSPSELLSKSNGFLEDQNNYYHSS